MLKDAKEKVRKALLNGMAEGIVGVGIDPTGTKSSEGSLVVFVSDDGDPKLSLQRILGSDLGFVEIQQGLLPLAANQFDKSFGFNEASSSLSLATAICQARTGRVGCFVEFPNGSKAVLTARHLFKSSELPVFFPASGGGCTSVIAGNSLHLPQLLPVNDAECAVFSSTLELRGNSAITGNVVQKNQLTAATGRAVVTRLSWGDGIIIDDDAIIEYPLPDSGGRFIIFNSQILVKSKKIEETFGFFGDSGALVFLNERVGGLDKGDAVGLYAWTNDMNKYHFVTPAYACMGKIGASRIINP